MTGTSDARTPIRVAVLERDETTRQEIMSLLSQSPNLAARVLSDVATFFELDGTEHHPDVILVGLDTEPNETLDSMQQLIKLAPTCGIIIYARDVTMELLSRAMSVGARRYVTYPLEAPALRTAIDDVYEQIKPLSERHRELSLPVYQKARDPKVVAIFSAKGGVGTSTLAVNLACALSTMKRRVVIVDGNISYGNIGVFLNISPSKSMLQLIGDPQGMTDAAVEEALLPHSSGIKVLLAPVRPEEADTINGDHMRAIIGHLRHHYDYVVVDTYPSYDERMLAMLDTADQILSPMSPDLPAVKNLAMFLRIGTEILNYPEGKVTPILMRANSVTPTYLKHFETFLKRPLEWRIVSDGKRVTQSVNNGEPFILSDPQTPVSQNITALARMIDGQPQKATINEVIPAEAPQPFWKRLLPSNSSAVRKL